MQISKLQIDSKYMFCAQSIHPRATCWASKAYNPLIYLIPLFWDYLRTFLTAIFSLVIS